DVTSRFQEQAALHDGIGFRPELGLEPRDRLDGPAFGYRREVRPEPKMRETVVSGEKNCRPQHEVIDQKMEIVWVARTRVPIHSLFVPKKNCSGGDIVTYTDEQKDNVARRGEPVVDTLVQLDRGKHLARPTR